MDPRDPRYPRVVRNGQLGDIPGEAYGQLPGLIGAPDREDYLRQHPPGAPEMPQPPPFPAGEPAAIRQQILLWLNGLRCVFEDRFITDLIATTVTSWRKQAFTPVHMQPWETQPFRAVTIGGTAAATIPAGGAWTNVVSGLVPVGYYGTLKQIGQDLVGSTDVWSSLTWRIAVGPTSTPASPIGGSTTYFTFAYQLGQIEAPTPLMALLVPEGWYFALQCSNASGGEIGVIGRIEGWMWPRTGGVTDGVAGQIVP